MASVQPRRDGWSIVDVDVALVDLGLAQLAELVRMVVSWDDGSTLDESRPSVDRLMRVTFANIRRGLGLPEGSTRPVRSPWPETMTAESAAAVERGLEDIEYQVAVGSHRVMEELCRRGASEAVVDWRAYVLERVANAVDFGVLLYVASNASADRQP